MANRLQHSQSPYLLQHADNPVDWHEWGEGAFAEAERRDVPILLSVGYAACHWCHVMAHESFEDPETAAYMNEHFVCVKVDREERPDVDAVYMLATQAMTGQGGWPMTVVLTPSREPFFAGTYFPSTPRHGMPSFLQLLGSLVDAWQTKRDQVDRVGADIVSRLGTLGSPGPATLGEDELDGAVRGLAGQYDSESGGFGTSPKFPPSMVLEFLLRYAHRTGSQEALAMVDHTCEAMARGGMYDQVGGGFARYSVDRFWQVPHFEKMLYDNALLLRVYLHWWRQTGGSLGERVARETADFLLAEMRTPEGGFASALDADSPPQPQDGQEAAPGQEGAYYVWTPSQLVELLGETDGRWAAALLNVTDTGTFERGASTLQLHADPDDPERWARVRAALHAARTGRAYPARDDKVVAAWNGLTVTALAEAGVLLDDARYTAAALEAADLLTRVHTAPDGSLVRTSRFGRASSNAGVLDDYGCVAEAYLALLGVTGDVAWLDRARGLLDRATDLFSDGQGGFYDTPADGEALVLRPRDVTDNASPSGTSAVAAALVAYAAVTGEGGYYDTAVDALHASGQLAADAPRFAGWALAVAEAVHAGPREVAVVGPDGPSRRRLHRAALRTPSPGAVVVAAPAGTQVPLLDGRDVIDGQPAAYVCRGFVCEQPVTDPDALVLQG